MRYISTRHGSQGDPAPLGFEDVMLAGLARDGGLYLPAEWPHFSTAEIASLKDLSYGELAFRIMRPFVGDAFDEATFRRLIGEAYASFETPEVAPLKALGDVTREDGGLHLLELFHGPTLAFKDVALQLLGRMLDLRPNCECCDKDLPNGAPDALICTYECTFCADCARTRLGGQCPNCGGDLVKRPTRPQRMLEKHPASTKRVRKDHAACRQVA